MEFKKNEEIDSFKEDIDTALEAARAINDDDYLAQEEARMSGDPEAVLRAQENQIRIATTEQEIASLQEALKKAMESNN